MFRFLTLLASLLSLGANTTEAAEPHARPDGARLYAQRCSACHGAEGRGGVGVPLALPAFLSSIDDAYLRKTVRLGRPGRVMPAFTQLTDAEVDAIVAHIRRWPGQQQPKTPSPDRIAGNVTRGKTLYERHCAACHGANGEGGHGTGVTLSRPRSAPILAPALNNPGFLAAATDTLIKTTLVNGRAGTPMVSFLKQGLKERDINDIVTYVRAFELLPPPSSARVLESESPVLMRESPYSFKETVDKVKTAVGAANMRLIRVQTLDQGFVEEGKENHQQMIVYSCDFTFLNEALKVDPRVGLFLPCRITIVQQGDKVLVMSINPKRLSRIFNNAELNAMCEQMHRVYTDILEETVL